MTNRNVLLKWFLPLLLLCVAAPAKAQEPYGFSSNNEGWISALVLPFETKTLVTLGNTKTEDCPNCQYYWEWLEGVQPLSYSDSQWPPTGIWPRVKNPIVEMPIGEALFRVTRVSEYGFQAEMVKVIVSDKITVNAKPKQCCWSVFDPITIDQFDITTDPPGYESYIVMDDDSQEAHPSPSLTSEYTQTVHFKHVSSNLWPIIGEVDVTVINSQYHSIGITPLSRSLVRAIDAFEKIDSWKGSFAKAEELMKPVKKLGPFDFDYDVAGTINIGCGMECCCTNKREYISMSGTASLSASFMLTGTPIYALPFVKLKIGAEGGISVSLVNFKLSESVFDEGECGCSSMSTLPLSFYVNIVGGVALESPLPDLMSVSGLAVGGVTGNLSYFSSDGFKWTGDMDMYLKIRAKAVLPFVTYSYEWILLD